jgi:sugar phosphate isomerase/epimerase
VASGKATKVTSGAYTVSGAPNWSPDGKKLGFRASPTPMIRDERGNAYVVDVASLALDAITTTNDAESAPQFSPDGKTLAFTMLPHEMAPHKDGIMPQATVNGFSGCPGDSPRGKMPNWVTCAWPDEYRDILEYQWRVAKKYWKAQNAFLAQHGVRFAIEMHPGFIVYNNDTLLKLRTIAGTNIGANFDPSHLWWQGIDPLVAVREIAEAGALFHCHAKDTLIDPQNSARNGNLDTKSYGDIKGRSWVFRSVGYGHDEKWWKDFISTIRIFDYDYVLSIEHEDGTQSTGEGLHKALDVLKRANVSEKPGEMFWARD